MRENRALPWRQNHVFIITVIKAKLQSHRSVFCTAIRLSNRTVSDAVVALCCGQCIMKATELDFVSVLQIQLKNADCIESIVISDVVSAYRLY